MDAARANLSKARCRVGLWAFLFLAMIGVIGGSLGCTWYYLYVEPRNHYLEEERLTTCNVTGYEVVVTKSDGGSMGPTYNSFLYVDVVYMSTDLDGKVNLTTSSYYFDDVDYIEHDPNVLAVSLDAPKRGAVISCYYQLDDPSFISLVASPGLTIPTYPNGTFWASLITIVIAILMFFIALYGLRVDGDPRSPWLRVWRWTGVLDAYYEARWRCAEAVQKIMTEVEVDMSPQVKLEDTASIEVKS